MLKIAPVMIRTRQCALLGGTGRKTGNATYIDLPQPSVGVSGSTSSALWSATRETRASLPAILRPRVVSARLTKASRMRA